MALHAERNGLFAKRLDTEGWRARLTTNDLYGDQWLLAYVVGTKGWLKSSSGHDYLGADEAFKWLRDIGVDFYDEDRAAPIPSPTAQKAAWEEELRREVRDRLLHYGQEGDGEDDAIAF